MQTLGSAFTAEAKSLKRNIAHNFMVSWHKQYMPNNRAFTIGVSIIGGPDVIETNPGALGSPGNYKYFDESQYVMSLGWERGLSIPLGGLSKGMAEAKLYNPKSGKKGRFTPDYLGGNSELYTAIVPQRPAIINAGFNYNGIDNVVPQFVGLFDKQPKIDVRNSMLSISMADYVNFFQNKYIDHSAMYTGVYTDVMLEGLFSQLGMSTSQYDLDSGLNYIPFALIEKGAKFSDVISKLVEAENGQLYQDEYGKFRFENRQHWDTLNPPVQYVINTSQVIESGVPDEDHLINIAEVKGQYRVKQPKQIIMNFSDPTYIAGNSKVELFFSYDDPVLEVIKPTNGGVDSFYIVNTISDGSGTDITANVSIKYIETFAQATKIIFQNNSATSGFITNVVISGRPAKQVSEIYYRGDRGASITAYEEHPITIDNEYISDAAWAQSYAEMLLETFSQIDNLQTITIRAMPGLQLGDLIGWQGRHWHIFDIKSTLDPSAGFIQELKLLQHTVKSYFRIGVSTIGGTDAIAP